MREVYKMHWVILHLYDIYIYIQWKRNDLISNKPIPTNCISSWNAIPRVTHMEQMDGCRTNQNHDKKM